MRKKVFKITSTAGKKSDLLLQTCTQRLKTEIVKHQIVTERGRENKLAKEAVLVSTMESLQRKSE